MNITKIKKSGDNCSFLDNSVNWKTKIKIKDGEYKVGIRPHNITTYKEEIILWRLKESSYF